MPLDERLEFLSEAWARLVRAGWQPALTDEQKVEFDRRLDELDAKPDDSMSWDDVERHVKSRR
jgi:putative addiction module component (TIGR02574 family)